MVEQTVLILMPGRGSDAVPLIPPPRTRCGQPSGNGGTGVAESATGSPVHARVLGAPHRCLFTWACGGCRVRVGLQAGKPRRASNSGVRTRTVAVTDFRAEQGLEVAPALPGNDRGARPRGDAWTASRKGKALEGRHRWGSAEVIAGMRRQGVETR
jgi:hypothetical protein